MKKEVVGILFSIFLISFVSAATFSLGDMLDQINASTLILGCLFLILFAILNFALGKFFKTKGGQPNRAVAGVVAFCIALMAIYGLNALDLRMDNILYDLGLTEEVLMILLPTLFFVGIIFMFWKLKSKALLLVSIILILIAALTDWVYEEGTIIGIGIFMFIIWAFMAWRSKKKAKNQSLGNYSSTPPRDFKKSKYDYRYFKKQEQEKRKTAQKDYWNKANLQRKRDQAILDQKRKDKLIEEEKTRQAKENRKKQALAEKAARHGVKIANINASAKEIEKQLDNDIRRKEAEERTKQSQERTQQEQEKTRQKELENQNERQQREQAEREREQEKRNKEAAERQAANEKLETERAQREKKQADQRAQEEEQRRQEAEERTRQEKERSLRKFILARKIGIRNLNEAISKANNEMQKGYKIAANLHHEATRLGWTKAGFKPGISKEQVKAAREAYRTWYRQYSRNIQLEKYIKECEARIQHLQNEINRATRQ